MIVNIVKFVLIVLYANAITAEDDINYADFLPICKRYDPDLNECLKNATVILQEKVIHGIPELKLPPIEPLKIPGVKLQQTTKSSMFKAVLMDVVLHGLSNYEFTDIQVDLENLTIYGQIYFDHIYMDSEYMLMGKFQMLPVEGSGRVMVNFTETMVDVMLSGALLKRKDKFYFMNHETDVKLNIGNSEAKFENMYSSSDEMSHINEHLINMHSYEILKELKPALETVASMLFDEVANKFFRNISFDKLFPE